MASFGYRGDDGWVSMGFSLVVSLDFLVSGKMECERRVFGQGGRRRSFGDRPATREGVAAKERGKKNIF